MARCDLPATAEVTQLAQVALCMLPREIRNFIAIDHHRHRIAVIGVTWFGDEFCNARVPVSVLGMSATDARKSVLVFALADDLKTVVADALKKSTAPPLSVNTKKT